ncbi:MAG: hypothetical protein MJ102_02480 [Clostridia bacterium]|nr:hypothetical protein [Clostridia bacterium]
MIYPTIHKLTNKGQFNRYQLAVATAKCARIITDEYVRQRHEAEKNLTGNKDVDRPMMENAVNPEYRDKKAVKLAIDKIDKGEYVIVNNLPTEETDEEKAD